MTEEFSIKYWGLPVPGCQEFRCDWHFLQNCMLPKFWYFQQKCMQMHVGNWHQHAYLHAHGCTCIQHACSISLLKWPKMHAFFKKCMHFSKMHAPFTYKMHAFMHAFLRKVSNNSKNIWAIKIIQSYFFSWILNIYVVGSVVSIFPGFWPAEPMTKI